ncbi:MAG: ABC transporter substrate-binding protein [Elusimicrobia bacterium]|nr:ABC transporter substrate-binding protein [Elusimicrobiota bacterium]
MIKYRHCFWVGAILAAMGGGFAGAKETELPLEVATQNYAHTRLLQERAVKVAGCELHYQTLSLSTIRHQAKAKKFDVMEVELLPFLSRLADGQPQEYTLIPVFLLREFPLRDIWVRTDRGIKNPQDLRGKRVGVDVYGASGATWIRKFLESSATIKTEDIVWVDVSTGPSPHKTLEELIQSGTVDAMIYPGTPEGAGSVVRLFKNYAQIEQELFKVSRVFPLATALAVRSDLIKENAWLPEALFMAFVEAKRRAVENLGTENEPKIPLPWGPESYQLTLDLMGKDYWSYGVPNNPRSLKALLDGAFEQGLLKRELKVDEIFEPSTLQLMDQ